MEEHEIRCDVCNAYFTSMDALARHNAEKHAEAPVDAMHDAFAKLRCDECSKEFGSQDALDAHNNAKHRVMRESRPKAKPGKFIYAIAVIVILIAAFFVYESMARPAGNSISGAATGGSGSGVQTATLRVSGSSYVLSQSAFKVGVPVEITADVGSMPGCSKAVTIPAFKIFKYVSGSDNKITFTPTKTGTFTIACSMSMYTGTFTVVQ